MGCRSSRHTQDSAAGGFPRKVGWANTSHTSPQARNRGKEPRWHWWHEAPPARPGGGGDDDKAPAGTGTGAGTAPALPVHYTRTARPGYRDCPPGEPGPGTGTARPKHRHCPPRAPVLPVTTGRAPAREGKGVPDLFPGPAPAVAPRTPLGSGDAPVFLGHPGPELCTPHCTPVLHPLPKGIFRLCCDRAETF